VARDPLMDGCDYRLTASVYGVTGELATAWDVRAVPGRDQRRSWSSPLELRRCDDTNDEGAPGGRPFETSVRAKPAALLDLD
jgi:hypothetical protein